MARAEESEVVRSFIDNVLAGTAGESPIGQRQKQKNARQNSRQPPAVRGSARTSTIGSRAVELFDIV